MTCDFTEAHYREVLRALLDQGYRFTGFTGFVPGEPRQLILRHDIDLSLEDALRMARLDAGEGVSSTFHVMLTAEVYNPMSGHGQAALKEIRQLGHWLGLHVDPQVGQASEDLVGALRGQLATGARVLGDVDSYSLHRPTVSGRMDELHPSRLPFPVPPYAYAAEFREAIIYRSDSRREWRHGCICREIAGFAGRSLQLALHPIWWTREKCTREELLQAYLAARRDAAEQYLRENLSFYKTGS